MCAPKSECQVSRDCRKRRPGKYQMPQGQKAPPWRLIEQLDIKMSEEDMKPKTAPCKEWLAGGHITKKPRKIKD